MDIGGSANIAGSDGGRGTAVGSVTGGGGILTRWTAGACITSALSLSGAWVGRTQGFRSTVGLYPGGGVELEEARFGPLSKAMSSAMFPAMGLVAELLPSVSKARPQGLVMAVRESSLRKSRLVGEFLIFLSSLPAKVIDFAVGENTMMVVPGVRDVLASVSILVCGDSVGSSCADGLCRNANQETECGIPYQDENKIDLRLINANGILILKIYMMHVCENVNAYGLIHVTRILVLLGAVIVFLLMAFQTVCSAYSCPRLFMSSGSS
ncbi:hypothetical protein CRG98_012298 [Punica granatum]|uniref:Uncharacterized protein n=1 Tax=Punica granatum TaxID=22663 RepID=A0A2I0KFJ4_PUNGR|nr:hypothetical protein CRG98_012298 [Punica granatum]